MGGVRFPINKHLEKRMLESHEFIDAYFDLPNHKPDDYQEIIIHGVREIRDEVLNEPECVIDDSNPEFYSAYVRHKDGCSEVIADASPDKLDALRSYAKQEAIKMAESSLDLQT